jgi:protocatechuate 3,4-dioxygenase beta subunit
VRRAAILLVVLAAGCGGSDDEPRDAAAVKRTCEPTTAEATRVDPAAAGTPSRVKLGPGFELEPTKRTLAAARVGTRLEVTGVVRGDDCAPLAGATLHAWQTNGNGRYGPVVNGRDRCCYLTGTVLTGEDGRYTLVTVMPRGYDGGPPHIHMEIGHPDAQGIVTEIVFDAPVTTREFDAVLE